MSPNAASRDECSVHGMRRSGFCAECVYGAAEVSSRDREWLSKNRHVAENYPRVCKAIGVEPWTPEAPVELGLINLDPLDKETLASLRWFDDQP